MRTYEIVDADCHVLEPPDIWKNWLPEKYQDKAPKLVLQRFHRPLVLARRRFARLGNDLLRCPNCLLLLALG